MPHDVDESQLDAMAARVAAVVTEEQAARVDKPLETVTPDFVAKCAGFAEKGMAFCTRRCSEENLFMYPRRRRGSSGLASSGNRRMSTGWKRQWMRSGSNTARLRPTTKNWRRKPATPATKNRQRASPSPPSVFGSGPAT